MILLSLINFEALQWQELQFNEVLRKPLTSSQTLESKAEQNRKRTDQKDSIALWPECRPHCWTVCSGKCLEMREKSEYQGLKMILEHHAMPLFTEKFAGFFGCPPFRERCWTFQNLRSSESELVRASDGKFPLGTVQWSTSLVQVDATLSVRGTWRRVICLQIEQLLANLNL